jgi:transposase
LREGGRQSSSPFLSSALSHPPLGGGSTARSPLHELGHDLQNADYPLEARSLGRTLIRWKTELAAWHKAHVTNGPTEAVSNLIKRVKRSAFGFTSFRNYRIHSLLYAGKSNWALLTTVAPR